MEKIPKITPAEGTPDGAEAASTEGISRRGLLKGLAGIIAATGIAENNPAEAQKRKPPAQPCTPTAKETWTIHPIEKLKREGAGAIAEFDELFKDWRAFQQSLREDFVADTSENPKINSLRADYPAYEEMLDLILKLPSLKTRFENERRPYLTAIGAGQWDIAKKLLTKLVAVLDEIKQLENEMHDIPGMPKYYADRPQRDLDNRAETHKETLETLTNRRNTLHDRIWPVLEAIPRVRQKIRHDCENKETRTAYCRIQYPDYQDALRQLSIFESFQSLLVDQLTLFEGGLEQIDIPLMKQSLEAMEQSVAELETGITKSLTKYQILKDYFSGNKTQAV